MIPRELKQLADTCGVLTAYEDVYKQRQVASAESLLAVLGTLGVDVESLDDVPQALEAKQLSRNQQGIEPVIVVWDGEPIECDLMLPAENSFGTVDCVVMLEDQSGKSVQQHDLNRTAQTVSSCGGFVTYRVPLPRGLKWGYHELAVETSARTYKSLIISAPSSAYDAQDGAQRDWGCFLPLYALRSERNWGAGDFTDLQNLAKWTSDLGGNVVGILPLLAAYLDDPCEPSPYAPASRLAWNEFYIDVLRVPEVEGTPGAAKLMQSTAFAEELVRRRESDFVEYRELMALKRRVLEMLAARFFDERPVSRFAEFESFLNTHPQMHDYARFRSARERQHAPWQDWPAEMRDGHLSADNVDQSAERYHLYVQWIAHEQLQSLAGATLGGLYLDLPLGVRSDGYDVWKWRQSYATRASAGSPPDAMWTKGQDWRFPPLHPEAIRELGYVHVRDYLRNHLQLARMLRIDHVMQLHRLYWIPHGLPPDQGVYVKYRHDELYAILALESHRCQAMLVGENLGTVPPEVDQAMDSHNLKQMYVVQYEVAENDDDRSEHAACAVISDAEEGSPAVDRSADGTRIVPASLSDVPSGAMASLNTHDMPTFAAWWRGEDLPLRRKLGLLNEQDAQRERERLDATRTQLTTTLVHEGWLTESDSEEEEILRAILGFLSASRAGVVLVNLEDLWLETQPQNVPGTGADLPNWNRKSALTFEDFSLRGDILSTLRIADELRRKSAVRAVQEK